jgi:hypothetical protein
MTNTPTHFFTLCAVWYGTFIFHIQWVASFRAQAHGCTSHSLFFAEEGCNQYGEGCGFGHHGCRRHPRAASQIFSWLRLHPRVPLVRELVASPCCCVPIRIPLDPIDTIHHFAAVLGVFAFLQYEVEEVKCTAQNWVTLTRRRRDKLLQ